MNLLELIGRRDHLFVEDLDRADREMREIISRSKFLVIGGGGSIGQAVAREIFRRNPLVLHAVDLSENSLVELVRDIRSSFGYIRGDFRTFAVDCGGVEFSALVHAEGPYDYVLNLSALKHVRSEKDPFTLMRMIEVNIFNTLTTIASAQAMRANKYFCVSTDKAANPVNLMGASKRIMEMFLVRESERQAVSTARFANVAFSDGSLLHGFNQRIAKRQPLSAPNDVQRYFITDQESGELCLLSCILGFNREIFFPRLSEELHLTTFSQIARRYLNQLGFEPVECSSEDEARQRAADLIKQRKWPCYFFKSDTTGEKDFEEFHTAAEVVDISRFKNIGIISNDASFDHKQLEAFTTSIAALRAQGAWSKQDLVRLFFELLPTFEHKETGKYLDGRM